MSIEQLQENGLTGPFELADKSLVDAVCEVGIELQALQRQENIVRQLAGQEPQFRTKIDRHMEFKVMRDLCLDDNVKSVVSEHFGNDLFIWGSVFQLKSEGVSENIWHHDCAYENGRDQVNLYDTSNHFTVDLTRFDRQIPLFSPLLLHDLLLPFHWYKINLNPLIQCDRDSLKHRKRVPFIIRIFEPCNYRLFGSDQFCQFDLRQARHLSGFIY